MSLRICGVILLTGLLMPSVCLAQARIELKNGQFIKVQKVLKAGYKTVSYRIVGSKQSMSAAEIKDYQLTSKKIETGLSHYRSKRLQKALKVFKRLSSTKNIEERAFVDYYYAKTLFALNKRARATTAFTSFLEAYPDHFYAPVVQFSLGQCLESLDRFDDARAQYNAAKKYGERWKSKASFAFGTSYFRESVHRAKPILAAKAIPIFQSLSSDESYKATASLYLVRIYLRVGQGEKAESLLTTLELMKLNKASERALFHLAKGDLLERQAQSKAALFQYFHALLLYGSTESGENAQRAAVRLSKALELRNIAQRCQRYVRRSNHKGPLNREAFVAAIFQYISSALALEKIEESLNESTGEEKLSLLFLKCKILAAMNKTEDHRKLLEFIKREYPEEFGRRNLDVAALIKNLDKLKKQWTRGKKQSERDSVQLKLKEALKNMKAVLDEKIKAAEKLEETIQTPKDQYRPDVVSAKRARDACHFHYGSGLYFLGLSIPENSAERLELLKSAGLTIEEFSFQCENFSMELMGPAFNLSGLIKLEQGKIKEALEEFDSVKEYSLPFGLEFRVQNPELAKRIKRLETSTRINAYRYYAKACSRKQALPLAVKELNQLKTAIPNNLRYVEGLLARFELCEYLARDGQVSEALEELEPIINKPESIHIANLSSETLRDEAHKALASVSDASGGAIFPPEFQFLAGLGYQIRGDDEAAIVGYKGVLTSAVTKEERARWVPKACQEMARLLYHQERYLEAALAFCILANEFPTHPEAPKALKKAKKSLSKALQLQREEDSDGPIHNLQKKIERILLNSGDNDTKTAILLKRAALLESKKKYIKAAAEYLLVPEFVVNKEKKRLPCQHYALAISKAGFCYSQDSQLTKSPQSYKQALKLLQQARQVAQRRNDNRAFSLASYYLAELANHKQDYQGALEYLRPLENQSANTASLTSRIRSQQMTAYIGLNQLSQAEEVYKSGADVKDPLVTTMALRLADAFSHTAKQENQKTKAVKATVQSYRVKAANYASDWVSRSQKLARNSLFWAASLIVNGQRYSKAISVYERLLKEFPRPEINGRFLGKKAQAESSLQDQYDLAKMNLARAYLIAGKSTEAAKLFTELKALVVLKKKNTLIARGSFVKEARETLRDDKGRPVRCRVYYVKVKNKELTYFVPPRQNPSLVLKGKDAAQSYGKRDLMSFRQRFKTNLIVLSGLAKASWLQYKRSGNKNDLVNSVQKAWNNYYLVISRLEESDYDDLKDLYALPQANYTDARMTVALRLLEIAYERGEYKHIVTSMANFEESGWLAECSAGLQRRFKVLRERALSKK